MFAKVLRALGALVLLALGACAQKDCTIGVASAPGPLPFKVTASIQDLMLAQIDPAADYLWDSVSTIAKQSGIVHNEPRTDAEWQEERHNAILLIEGANLLMMEGRRVVAVGKQLEHSETGEVLTAEQAQQAIDSAHPAFVAFATALHDVGMDMLKAIDAKNPDAILETGEALDRVCESCHLKFWYPEQAKTVEKKRIADSQKISSDSLLTTHDSPAEQKSLVVSR